MKIIHMWEPKHKSQNAIKRIKSLSKIKPDIVLFEYPLRTYPLSYLNKFDPDKKPRSYIKRWEKYFQGFRDYPYLKSQSKILEFIETMWESGKQVLLFEIDAPP